MTRDPLDAVERAVFDAVEAWYATNVDRALCDAFVELGVSRNVYYRARKKLGVKHNRASGPAVEDPWAFRFDDIDRIRPGDPITRPLKLNRFDTTGARA